MRPEYVKICSTCIYPYGPMYLKNALTEKEVFTLKYVLQSKITRPCERAQGARAFRALPSASMNFSSNLEIALFVGIKKLCVNR